MIRNNEWITKRAGNDYDYNWDPVLETIYNNGDILRHQTFDEIRNIAGFNS